MDITKNGNCVYRAFIAAFRYARLPVPSFPEGSHDIDKFKAFARAYGLEIVDKGTYNPKNRPLIVVYKVPYGKHHAVFSSDLGAAKFQTVTMFILGWENFTLAQYVRGRIRYEGMKLKNLIPRFKAKIKIRK
jgi:hypothetical protein